MRIQLALAYAVYPTKASAKGGRDELDPRPRPGHYHTAISHLSLVVTLDFGPAPLLRALVSVDTSKSHWPIDFQSWPISLCCTCRGVPVLSPPINTGVDDPQRKHWRGWPGTLGLKLLIPAT